MTFPPPRSGVRVLVFLFSCGLVLSAGCGAGGSGGGSTSIKGTSVDYTSYNGRLAFVIWTNQIGGGPSGSDRGAGGMKFYGSVGHDKKTWAKWQGQTADGKTGTVTINGVSYELSKGPLFFVSVEGDQAKVRQLQRDLSEVEPSAKGLENFAKTDPEVAKFVAAPGNPK